MSVAPVRSSPRQKEDLSPSTNTTSVLPEQVYVPPSRISEGTVNPGTTYTGNNSTGVTPVDVTAGNLIEQSGNQIANQLSGNSYASLALQNQQALARAEANQRAKTASAIHSAGFSGTPLGAAAGNATEAELLRNRFDTNLGIEVERQKSMNDGAANALQYGDAVNKWKADTAATRQQLTSQAFSNASSMLMSDPILQEQIRTLSKEDGVAAVDKWLQNNPRAQEYFAQYFERDYTAEDVYDFNTNMRYSSDAIYNLASALAGVNGDPSIFMEAARNILAGEWVPTVDENGNLQYKTK